MTRWIDADALIEELEPEVERVDDFVARTYVRAVINDIKKYPSVNQWIPVSERLPKELINPVTLDFYEYLCTIKIDDDYYVRTYKFGDMHWWHASQMMDKYVIAWMSLPEPYRRKNETESLHSTR